MVYTAVLAPVLDPVGPSQAAGHAPPETVLLLRVQAEFNKVNLLVPIQAMDPEQDGSEPLKHVAPGRQAVLQVDPLDQRAGRRNPGALAVGDVETWQKVSWGCPGCTRGEARQLTKAVTHIKGVVQHAEHDAELHAGPSLTRLDGRTVLEDLLELVLNRRVVCVEESKGTDQVLASKDGGEPVVFGRAAFDEGHGSGRHDCLLDDFVSKSVSGSFQRLWPGRKTMLL